MSNHTDLVYIMVWVVIIFLAVSDLDANHYVHYQVVLSTCFSNTWKIVIVLYIVFFYMFFFRLVIGYCFTGTARTSLIVTIGPSPRHRGETASTIQFGQRVSAVYFSVKGFKDLAPKCLIFVIYLRSFINYYMQIYALCYDCFR